MTDIALKEVFSLDRQVHVLDLGCVELEQEPEYKQAVLDGIAKLTGVDPTEKAARQMFNLYEDSAKHIDAVIGDGSEKTLYVFDDNTGLTSVQKPDLDWYAQTMVLAEKATEDAYTEETVQTVKLDDLEIAGPVDYLHMDIQGSELDALLFGSETLKDTVAIRSEVTFNASHIGRPLVGDLDSVLQERGFRPYEIVFGDNLTLVSKTRKIAFGSQLSELDILYTKDPRKMDQWSVDQVKSMGILALTVFKDIGLAAQCAENLLDRDEISEDLFVSFLAHVSGDEKENVRKKI